MHLEENKDGPDGGHVPIQVHQQSEVAPKTSGPDLEFIASQNWYEGRPKDKIPERRAYHISFVHNNK